MTIRLHRGDLPDLARYKGAVAIDTETMGLDPHRDRLCVVQLSPGDGSADVVQIAAEPDRRAQPRSGCSPIPSMLKIFHFARFDLGMLYQGLRRDAGAGLLHQDRLAADPHLYRQARPEGPGREAARHRPLEAAAIVRLGRRDTHRGAGRLRRRPTCCICMR